MDAPVRRVEKINIKQDKKIEGKIKNDLDGGSKKGYEIVRIKREDND